MDGSDRWRMIGCAHGAQDKTIVNQILLRFRPIAPRPTNCTASGLVDSGRSFIYNKNTGILVSKRRNKRKYIRVRKNNNGLKRNQQRVPLSSSDHQKKGKENDREKEDDGFNKTVTLQLMPERSDESKDREERGRSRCNQVNNNNNSNHDNDNYNSNTNNGHNDAINQEKALELKLKQPAATMIEVSDEMTTTEEKFRKEKVAVESWVRVECVTETYDCASSSSWSWMDGIRSGGLEEETRPGFISDGSNRVRWVNNAYKRMMMMMITEDKKEDDQLSMEIKVWLVSEEKLKPYLSCSGFTCWVRLQCYKSNYVMEKGKCSSQMVPCDVWRSDPGGWFAWRLDVDAALSLGR